MPSLPAAYAHLPAVLAPSDIEVLKEVCKQHLLDERIPCYALIDRLDTPTYVRIKRIVEEIVGEPLYYLNDFYIYTDVGSKTDWHVDTELFTFESAVNAWILLSPECVANPIGLLSDINDVPERFYHNAKRAGDRMLFEEFRTRKTTTRALTEIEAQVISTPKITTGDVLLLNPRRFHRTNLDLPKHSFAIKFVAKSQLGFLTQQQVRPFLWPEVALFSRLVREAAGWEEVIEGIRMALKTELGRKHLTAGFYPERFPMYREMVKLL